MYIHNKICIVIPFTLTHIYVDTHTQHTSVVCVCILKYMDKGLERQNLKNVYVKFLAKIIL